jgi:trigger factor
MDFQVENVSAVERKLNFNISGEQVNTELEKAFRNMQARAKLKGFRPGKVPRAVLEQRFGKSIRAEVASELINRSFRQAAASMDFFGQPRVNRQTELTANEAFSFSITLEVKPELELTTYKGVKVTYPKPVVTDEQVEAQITRRLQSQSSLAEVTGRGVAAGDYVLAELEIRDGDAVVHSHPGSMVYVDGDVYYAGIETLLTGANTGDTVEGSVNFGANAQLPELAGRTLTVKATVQSIQAMQTPELSDELAAQLGYEGGAEAMRLAIRGKLEASAEEAGRNQARATLLQKLIELNNVEAPKGLIEQQLADVMEELRVQRTYSGEDPRRIQFNEAQLGDLRTRAKFAAQAGLLIERVAQLESISVSDAEIDEKLQALADSRGQQIEAIRGYFQKENAIEDLRGRLLQEKVIDWLLEAAELETVDPANDNDEAPAEAPAAE